MIIMFEGPDGSGKSTTISFIKGVLKSKGYTIIPNGEDLIPTHPTAERRIKENLLYRLLKDMSASDKVYLVDRGPISDFIYRVFDDYSTVTQLNKFLDALSTYKGLFIVYCKNSKSQQYMLERGEDNPTALNRYKELTKVYDIFMSMLKCIHLSLFEYDWTKRSAKTELVNKILYFCYLRS